jgi:flagellar basal body-associated protein FliL
MNKILNRKGGQPRMLKKKQKWTALMVTIAFSWMVHISAMPMAAADETEQPGPASVDQAPGFVEQQGVILSPGGSRPVKIKVKTVLIIFGVLCALAIIISVFFRGIGHEAARPAAAPPPPGFTAGWNPG